MQSSTGLPFAALFFCFCLFTCAVVVSRFLLRDMFYGSVFSFSSNVFVELMLTRMVGVLSLVL